MRQFVQELARSTTWALLLIGVLLWAGTASISGDAARAGAESVGRSLELPLRDLSAWLAASAPERPHRKPVTIGLRN